MQSVRARPIASTPSTPSAPTTTNVFDRSRFFLRQKHFSLQEKYFVWDERGQKLAFVERPRHHLRSIVAILGAVASFIAAAMIGMAATSALLVAVGAPEAANGIGAIVAMLFGIASATVVGVALSAKRHVTFYRDETKREPLLKVEQDNKFQLFLATYSVVDPAGNLLARLSKNYLYDVFRKRWYWDDTYNRRVCVVKEDSVFKSIARRLLGPMFGVLRTNFVFLCGDVTVGKFDRQLTLFDRYVLDMTQDVEGTLDRRVALAVGVMLDTGEKR